MLFSDQPLNGSQRKRIMRAGSEKIMGNIETSKSNYNIKDENNEWKNSIKNLINDNKKISLKPVNNISIKLKMGIRKNNLSVYGCSVQTSCEIDTSVNKIRTKMPILNTHRNSYEGAMFNRISKTPKLLRKSIPWLKPDKYNNSNVSKIYMKYGRCSSVKKDRHHFPNSIEKQFARKSLIPLGKKKSRQDLIHMRNSMIGQVSVKSDTKKKIIVSRNKISKVAIFIF